jgi:hypothetical protein
LEKEFENSSIGFWRRKIFQVSDWIATKKICRISLPNIQKQASYIIIIAKNNRFNAFILNVKQMEAKINFAINNFTD